MPNAITSICPFCAMGCTYLLKPGTGAPYIGEADVSQLDYDVDHGPGRGSLCAKGNMALELLTHPSRLEAPEFRTDSHRSQVSWEEALGHVSARLELLRGEKGPESIGLVLGPYLTNEEVEAARAFAARLGTPHVDGGPPEDRLALLGIERSGARAEPITSTDFLRRSAATLAVGDVFTVAPCLAKSVLDARYDRRQNLLGTLGGVPSRTAWFGKPDLRCGPGHEPAGLALLLRMALEREGAKTVPWAEAAQRALGERPLEELSGLDAGKAAWLVDGLLESEASAVLVGATFGATERPDLVAGLAALLAEATGSRFLALGPGPNAVGLRRTLDAEGRLQGGLSAPEMFEAAVTGDIDALIALGWDPLGALPGPLPRQAAERLSLFVVTGPFPGESGAWAHVTLPTTTWGEKAGHITDAFGDTRKLESALPPPGSARADLEVLEALGERISPWPAPPEAKSPAPPAGDAATFLTDLELYLRLERREIGAHTTGRHLLVPLASAAQSGDGWLTRPLSWPRHETPRPELQMAAAPAAALGLASGDRVRVRSNQGEAVLHLRVESRLPEDVVLAPGHEPAVRSLLRWHVDGVVRDLDLAPSRVSVERAEENGHE